MRSREPARRQPQRRRLRSDNRKGTAAALTSENDRNYFARAKLGPHLLSGFAGGHSCGPIGTGLCHLHSN